MKKELIHILIGLYITFWISAFALIFPRYTIVTEVSGEGTTEYLFLGIIGFFINVLWVHVIIVDIILVVRYFKMKHNRIEK